MKVKTHTIQKADAHSLMNDMQEPLLGVLVPLIQASKLGTEAAMYCAAVGLVASAFSMAKALNLDMASFQQIIVQAGEKADLDHKAPREFMVTKGGDA